MKISYFVVLMIVVVGIMVVTIAQPASSASMRQPLSTISTQSIGQQQGERELTALKRSDRCRCRPLDSITSPPPRQPRATCRRWSTTRHVDASYCSAVEPPTTLPERHLGIQRDGLDSTTARQLTVGNRTSHTMTYDSARQRVVLFGGYDFGWPADTWEWDGVNWTQRTTATHPARRNRAMAFDEYRGALCLADSPISSPARPGSGMASTGPSGHPQCHLRPEADR